MRISSEQMRALGEASRRLYVQEMARMLGDDFPESFGARRQGDVEEFVLRAMEHGERHGVTLRSDLTFYIRLQAILSPGFSDPRDSWAREILERRDLNGTEKMDRIHDHIVFVQAGHV